MNKIPPQLGIMMDLAYKSGFSIMRPIPKHAKFIRPGLQKFYDDIRKKEEIVNKQELTHSQYCEAKGKDPLKVKFRTKPPRKVTLEEVRQTTYKDRIQRLGHKVKL